MSNLSAQFTIGSVRVAALSDGAPERELGGFFMGIDPAEWTKALGITSANQPVPFNFGVFLIQDGQHRVLVDSGWGPGAVDMGFPGGGGLIDRLAEIGVQPGDVDMLVHTHLHPDHVGWSATGEGDAVEPGFPNATIVLAQQELEYWTHPQMNSHERAPIARKAILPAQTADRIVTFEGEYEIAPGITTVPTPGHTPGHTSIMLASQGEHLLLVGDAAHHPTHFEHHNWIPGVDLDPSESTRSRRKVCELAIEKDALVTSGHFPILTLGHVRRAGEGYRWEGAEATPA